MGKRTGLGIGILIFFLIGGILGAKQMENLCKPICRDLENAQNLVKQGQDQQASQLIDSAYRAWKKNRFHIAAFVNHDPIDEIDGLFFQTQIYGQLKEKTDFAAGCGRLSQLIDALWQSHKFTWWNLF